jgi:ABC-type branched-subunit amino acid transport system substrate-binding protein
MPKSHGTSRAGIVGAVTLAVGVSLAAAPAAYATKSYDINVVLPLTGGAAFVGQGQKDALSALQEHANATGGIHGEKLHLCSMTTRRVRRLQCRSPAAFSRISRP